MPSTTFFRLPEEKRRRLLEAAREEFEQVRFNDVSINRIIQKAGIPRGSFYQYFTDKEDLFRYLLGDMRTYFFQALVQFLKKAGGDLFAVPLRAFDHFIAPGGSTDPMLSRFIRIMQLNQGMDARWLLGDEEQAMSEQLLQEMDLTCFRQSDPVFAGHVFCLTIMVLAHSIAASVSAPEQWEQMRTRLIAQLEIIRLGALATPAGCVPVQQGGTL